MYLANQSGVAAQFWRQGFVIIRNAFTREEAALIHRAVSANQDMDNLAKRIGEKFKSGKYPSFETLFVWNDTSGKDIFAKITRSNKIMVPLQQIFDDDVYVYHNKVVLKYPNMPGFKYHQDYYYWYNMGCLSPDMATCFVAIDPATRENGCLKLVEGSHRLGRLEHMVYNDHTSGISDSGVDPERLEAILKRLPQHYIELDPGDCVIFHCNTLHGSDANLSEGSRLAMLGCYNTGRNDPYVRKHDHPNFILQDHIHEPITEADLENMPDFALHYRDR